MNDEIIHTQKQNRYTLPEFGHGPEQLRIPTQQFLTERKTEMGGSIKGGEPTKKTTKKAAPKKAAKKKAAKKR